MLKKIILLFGILIFSNSAYALIADDIHPRELLQNLAEQFLVKMENSEATTLQFQKATEESGYFSINQIAKKCAIEINNRIEKDRKISGKDYRIMYYVCGRIAAQISIESWREEWVNYDYANHRATPRELLYTLYDLYIGLKFCYLNREDYKVQYITYGEFKDIKQKISELEKSLENSLIDISIKDFWDSSMSKLNGAQIISSAKKSTAYQEDLNFTCLGAKKDFYRLIDANSEPAKLEKDF